MLRAQKKFATIKRKSGRFCGRGSMVERDLAKVETRVRFSSPAPFNQTPNIVGGFLYYPSVSPW